MGDVLDMLDLFFLTPHFFQADSLNAQGVLSMENLLLKLGQLRQDQVGYSVADGGGLIGQKLHVLLGIKSSNGIQQADAALLNQGAQQLIGPALHLFFLRCGRCQGAFQECLKRLPKPERPC